MNKNENSSCIYAFMGFFLAVSYSLCISLVLLVSIHLVSTNA
jgi:hypothetical protein